MNAKVYAGDSIRLMIPGLVTARTLVPYGTKLKGVYFDGYPQLVKQRGSRLSSELLRFSMLLQEFRISQFAPELGTLEKVSPKILQAALQLLDAPALSAAPPHFSTALY